MFELTVTVTGYDESHRELPEQNTLIVTFLYENYGYKGTYGDNEFWFSGGKD